MPPQNFLEGCPPTSPLDNKLSGESFQNKRNVNLPPRNTNKERPDLHTPLGSANRACFITPKSYLFSVNKKILFFVSNDRKPTNRELCNCRACASRRGLLQDQPVRMSLTEGGYCETSPCCICTFLRIEIPSGSRAAAGDPCPPCRLLNVAPMGSA